MLSISSTFHFPSALLATNRQICTEALDIFCGRNSLKPSIRIDSGVFYRFGHGKPVPFPQGQLNKSLKSCRSVRLEICILGDFSTSTARLQKQLSSQIKRACDIFLVEMPALREIELEWLDLSGTDCLAFQLPCLEPLKQLANEITITVGHSSCQLRNCTVSKVFAEGVERSHRNCGGISGE